jgi:hypothetical protein
MKKLVLGMAAAAVLATGASANYDRAGKIKGFYNHVNGYNFVYQDNTARKGGCSGTTYIPNAKMQKTLEMAHALGKTVIIYQSTAKRVWGHCRATRVYYQR